MVEVEERHGEVAEVGKLRNDVMQLHYRNPDVEVRFALFVRVSEG